MQTTYSNALKDLLRWIDNINDALRSGMNFMRTGNEVQAVLHWVSVIQKNIGEDYLCLSIRKCIKRASKSA